MSMYDAEGSPIRDTVIAPIVDILSASGFLDYNSGAGNNARLEFKTKISGTYCIEAGEEYGHPETYTLTVERTG